jgi:hypothetical protein
LLIDPGVLGGGTPARADDGGAQDAARDGTADAPRRGLCSDGIAVFCSDFDESKDAAPFAPQGASDTANSSAIIEPIGADADGTTLLLRPAATTPARWSARWAEFAPDGGKPLVATSVRVQAKVRYEYPSTNGDSVLIFRATFEANGQRQYIGLRFDDDGWLALTDQKGPLPNGPFEQRSNQRLKLISRGVWVTLDFEFEPIAGGARLLIDGAPVNVDALDVQIRPLVGLSAGAGAFNAVEALTSKPVRFDFLRIDAR